MTNANFFKRLREYQEKTRKLDGPYQNENNCLVVCDSLSEPHYLVGIGDLRGRCVHFYIIDILGKPYLIPPHIEEACSNVFIHNNPTRLDLTKNTLEIILYWLLPRLQEYFQHTPMVALSEKVPQYVLDLFYNARKYEIFDKVRKKIKEDAEKEEHDQR